jgi:hypothetical protein
MFTQSIIFNSPILRSNLIPDKGNSLDLLFQFRDLVLEEMLSLFLVKQGNGKAIQQTGRMVDCTAVYSAAFDIQTVCDFQIIHGELNERYLLEKR